jgi:hypothetical protein
MFPNEDSFRGGSKFPGVGAVLSATNAKLLTKKDETSPILWL